MWLLGKLTLATMLVASQAADINTQFWVEKATGPVTRSGQSGDLGGSCAPYMDVLNDIYLEAIDMAEVALEALNNYASNPVIRATLQTYMGIKPDGTEVSAAHTSQFNYIKGAYNTVVAFGNLHYGSDRQPAFFCDGGWRWKTTMEYVDGKQTGRTVSEASGGISSYMYYSPRFKTWAGMQDGCGDSATLGFFLSDPRSITICPAAWTWKRRKDSLKPWRDGTRVMRDGRPFYNAYSLPGTFLHELIHLTSESIITDKKVIVDGQEKPAYFPNNVAELAKSSVDDARLNADSYAWFATAMYLPAMDWSREIAGTYTGSKVSSRMVGNITSYIPEENGLKRRSDFASPAVRNLEEYEDDVITDYLL
ncbi:hypothetical protein BO79DRAFT_239903 [Aspergillus costaricaensis CBS 115574]|uniref:Uncharacterized protein n=1 Tax=Aspergillus costaricaensis CBS 115574 TaxID=1448317 RepID=A0ACD1I4S6_9EURO|nr:hypothetical protein BO79DRAFT_239903 [Aspergillus costaricaensis CBS 115574]RAK85367.1 hypothetical protein BO79DRAFT_239903 [Aspergillus costaricaensis CBS 115574]